MCTNDENLSRRVDLQHHLCSVHMFIRCCKIARTSSPTVAATSIEQETDGTRTLNC